MSKNFTFYLAVLLLFGSGIYAILSFGSRLRPATVSAGISAGGTVSSAAAAHPGAGPATAKAKAAGGSIARTLLQNARSPLSILLLQVVIIVAAARILGTLFFRIKQPPVIGEMIAGILLGPSLLGMVVPRAQAFLFPASSMGALQMLSQIGVILFMF